MKISKKKLNELRLISVFEKILLDNGYTFLQRGGPDTWFDDEKKLFDILTETEDKMRDSIIEKLTES